MSRAYSSTQFQPPADQGEVALADLRQQLEAMKQRMSERRSQLHAAGLTRDEPAEQPEG